MPHDSNKNCWRFAKGLLGHAIKCWINYTLLELIVTEIVFQAIKFTSWVVYTGTSSQNCSLIFFYFFFFYVCGIMKIYLNLLSSLFVLGGFVLVYSVLGFFVNMLPGLFACYLLLLQILLFGPYCIYFYSLIIAGAAFLYHCRTIFKSFFFNGTNVL